MTMVIIGEKVTREPPVIRCKCTLLESPTERRVRPSGDIEAVAMRYENVCTDKEGTHTMVNGDIELNYAYSQSVSFTPTGR